MSRINPLSDRVVATIRVGPAPSGIAIGIGAVWVADHLAGKVYRIDPAANLAFSPISVAGREADDIAVGYGDLWVRKLAGDKEVVSRIDPISGKVIQDIAVGTGLGGIAVGEGAVWVVDSTRGTVIRIDPTTNTLKKIGVGRLLGNVAVGDGAVWVTNQDDGTVSRIDPAKNTVVDTIKVSPESGAILEITVDSQSVWVLNHQDGSVTRINPTTHALEQVVGVGTEPFGIASGAGGVWVASSGDSTVSHLGP